MKDKYERAGLRVVSVHTPKIEREKERAYVARAAERYKLETAIYLDNDRAYWDALGATWRPVFYLVDRKGVIRGRHNGELRLESSQGSVVEAMLQQLLAEPAS